MTLLRFFFDFHYGRRRPNLEFAVNQTTYQPRMAWSGGYQDCLEHAIMEFEAELADVNDLEIIMRDKTDQDLVFADTGMIDHLVEIMDIEIDGIRLEHLLYKTGEFRHSMPTQWVESMRVRGIDIQPVYPNGTQLRLNGTWHMQFTLPFWLWCANQS